MILEKDFCPLNICFLLNFPEKLGMYHSFLIGYCPEISLKPEVDGAMYLV